MIKTIFYCFWFFFAGMITSASAVEQKTPAPLTTVIAPEESNSNAAQEVSKEALLEKISSMKFCDEKEGISTLSILDTKHGVMADMKLPFAEALCQGCHGRIREGKNAKGEPCFVPTIQFGEKSKTPVVEQEKPCIKCHETGLRMNWKGSQHETAGLACSNCHKVHVTEDKVMNKRTEQDVCFCCHKTQRAQIHRPSSHPILEGKMACSSCHSVMGSPGPKLLKKPTINETCYNCHAEKRGPFLWEHPPATESCLNCHTPHGSNHATLLNARLPWLCQRCHSARRHPSEAYAGRDAPNVTTAESRLLSKSCENCHFAIHGSNHPSGATRLR